MKPSLLSLAALTVLLQACATPNAGPANLQCPRPPQIPALTKLPAEVTAPSFLQRLESRMWQKPSAPTRSE